MQNTKKTLQAKVKAILPKGWKVSFRADYQKIVCVVRELPKADLLVALPNAEQENALFERYTLDRENVSREQFNQDFVTRSKIEDADELEWFFHIAAVNNAAAYAEQFMDKQKRRELPNQDNLFCETLKKIVEIMNSENYNNSDVMRDYFDVGYYPELRFGTWDKPCKLI